MEVWLYYEFAPGDEEPDIRLFGDRAKAVEQFYARNGSIADSPDWVSGDINDPTPEWYWTCGGVDVRINRMTIE